MGLNQIGQYEFDIIQGIPGILTDSVELIERANVNGTGLRGLGRRGQQFTITSITTTTDLEACRGWLVAYETLVGDNPVQVVINDVDYYSLEGVVFSVLGVAPIRMQRTGAINSKGVGATSAAVLYTAWQLKMIEV